MPQLSMRRCCVSPGVWRPMRESYGTSRLCAPVNPDSSSRTCGPSLRRWWRTEEWSLLTLWVSKHIMLFLFLCFLFFFSLSNQVLGHACQNPLRLFLLQLCYCHHIAAAHECPFYLLCIIKISCVIWIICGFDVFPFTSFIY